MYSEWQALPPPPPLPAPLGVNRNLQGDTMLRRGGNGSRKAEEPRSGRPGRTLQCLWLDPPLTGVTDKGIRITSPVDSALHAHAQPSNPRTTRPREGVIHYKEP